MIKTHLRILLEMVLGWLFVGRYVNIYLCMCIYIYIHIVYYTFIYVYRWRLAIIETLNWVYILTTQWTNWDDDPQ
jgi:hypothetical protein